MPAEVKGELDFVFVSKMDNPGAEGALEEMPKPKPEVEQGAQDAASDQLSSSVDSGRK